MSNKLQAAAQLRRAVQLFAASLGDEAALEIAGVYPVWAPERTYAAGDYFTYGVNTVGDPQLYRVAQAHTSQAEWAPGQLPALYTPLGLNELGFPLWSRPAGAHDAYAAGDMVDYKGTMYRSLEDGNVWSPEERPEGWETVSESDT